MKQNVDYELTPGEQDFWNVRFLTGPFVETVIRVGNLKVSDDEEHLNFNFHLVSSPDDVLSESDQELQQAVGKVLNDLLIDAVARLEESKNQSK